MPGKTTLRIWWAVTERVELVLDALREIRGHKLRSALTLFGIVFGAAAVVSMTSLASALKVMAYDELERLGMPRTIDFEELPTQSLFVDLPLLLEGLLR